MTEVEEKAFWGLPQRKAAHEQGWGIFEIVHSEVRAQKLVDGRPYGDRPFELQKDDEMDVFEQDADAWAFVCERAAAGDELCKTALQFLAENSPAEHEAIMRNVSEKG